MVPHTQQILQYSKQMISGAAEIATKIIHSLAQHTKLFLGEDRWTTLKAYFKQNAYFYMGIGGSLLVFWTWRCWSRHNKKKQSQKHQRKPGSNNNSKKLPSSLKSKGNFIISQSNQQNVTDEDQAEFFPNQKNDSTCEGEGTNQVSKKRKKKLVNSDNYEAILQQEVQKLSGEKIILEDSLSDKVFNEMYGMYSRQA